MERTHWKKLTNPDYLGAYSLEEGKDLILTIKSVGNEIVTGSDGKKEQCTVAKFSENVKPMILNVTNMKTIAKIYNNPYIEDWAGKKIQIYSAKVKAFGEIVDALRIREFIPHTEAPKKILCTECGEELKPQGKHNAEWLADYTKNKYGKALCSACATKAAQSAASESEVSE